jgi:hypothetical protein
MMRVFLGSLGSPAAGAAPQYWIEPSADGGRWRLFIARETLSSPDEVGSFNAAGIRRWIAGSGLRLDGEAWQALGLPPGGTA